MEFENAAEDSFQKLRRLVMKKVQLRRKRQINEC